MRFVINGKSRIFYVNKIRYRFKTEEQQQAGMLLGGQDYECHRERIWLPLTVRLSSAPARANYMCNYMEILCEKKLCDECS